MDPAAAPRPQRFEMIISTRDDEITPVTHIVECGEAKTPGCSTPGVAQPTHTTNASTETPSVASAPAAAGSISDADTEEASAEEGEESSGDSDSDQTDQSEGADEEQQEVVNSGETELLRPYRPLPREPVHELVTALVRRAGFEVVDTSGAAPTPSAAAVAAPRAFSDEDLAAADDAAWDVHFWALAESHFPQHPSVLASEGVVRVARACTGHARVAFVAAGLRMLAATARHPDCVAEMLYLPTAASVGPSESTGAAAAAAAPATSASPRPTTCENLAAGADAFLGEICGAMRRFPNRTDVQLYALRVLCDTVAPNTAVPLASILERSDCVGLVLTAALNKSHAASTDVALVCAQFLAAMCDRNETTTPATAADAPLPPVAALFANVGAVLPTLLHLSNSHPEHLDITACVVRCLRVMASLRCNHEALIESAAVLRLLHGALKRQRLSPDVAADAVRALSALAPEYTLQQLEALVGVLQRVMTSHTRPDVLAVCCAAAIRCLQAADAAACDEDARRDAELRLQRQGDALRLRTHMVRHLAPFVAAALQHFGRRSQQLALAANACLRLIAIDPRRDYAAMTSPSQNQ